MLKNSHCPSGLKVAPANSLPLKSPVMPLRWPASCTLFLQSGKMLPPCVRPCMNCSPLPSSHSTRPPRGVTHMLSGASRTAAEGDSKISVSVLAAGS
jgi:hypothetical protein